MMKIRRLILQYKSDEMFRNKVNLYSGALTSLVFAGIQLFGGIQYQSIWFIALAVYNGVLSVVKFYLARAVGKTGVEGWRVFRLSGFVMTILNLALIVMVSFLVADPSIALHKYGVWIAVANAIWTLVSAILTVQSVVKIRNKNNPVELADRLVALTTSVVAVLMLQTSLIASVTTPQIEMVNGYIAEFGSFAMIPQEISRIFIDLFQRLATSNSITGVLVIIFTSGLTVYMIIRGTIERKKLSDSPRKR